MGGNMDAAAARAHRATKLTLPPVLTVDCPSCVTDVSNCLLGVMFLPYEHNSATNDIDRKKNGLYIKIERNR